VSTGSKKKSKDWKKKHFDQKCPGKVGTKEGMVSEEFSPKKKKPCMQKRFFEGMSGVGQTPITTGSWM
jgi:hypothetical protein